jgi:hypothetical protein
VICRRFHATALTVNLQVKETNINIWSEFMSQIDRRNFLKLSASTLVGITMGSVSLRALADEQIKLDDPLAMAMKYVNKSTVEGAMCGNCAHIQGDAAAEWRPCNIFPGKLVNKNGWCAAWMKMPG